MNTGRIGYLFVAAAAILFGLSGAASKFLFNTGMTPFQLIQLRTTIAFISLFLYLILKNRTLLRIDVKDLFYFAILGILGIASAQFFYLFAALVWNILHPPFSALMQAHDPREWWWILFIGICGTTLPFGLYFEGIKRINATHASITATLEPVTAAVIAMIFLGENMTLPQITGGIIVIVSIIVLQLKQGMDH